MAGAPLFFFFLFGLIIGSFINVLTLRFGFQEMPRHRSACQACQATLRWYELLPLVSHAALGGECRRCGSRVSFQYPAVEFLTGALFAAAYSAVGSITNAALAFSFASLLVFFASFIALLVYDVRHTLIPTVFVFPLIVSAFAVRLGEAAFVGSAFPIEDALIGALFLGAVLFVIVAVTRGKGMGLGDVYISASLGALFGVARGIEVIMLAFWIGAAVGIVLIALKKGVRMKSEVPFVPFLFVASLVGAFTALSPFALVGRLTSLVWP